MSDAVNLPSGLNPLQVQIAALLRGVGSVEAVVQTAWPGTRLDWFQVDLIRCTLLSLIGKYREIAVKGSTGCGKGASTAMAACLFFEMPGSQVVISSESYQHAKSVFFAEMVSWRQKMRYAKPCEILDGKMRGPDIKETVSIVNPEKSEGISGHHGQNVLIVFDEATGVNPAYYYMAQTQAHLIIALANPRTASGWFRRLFSHTDPDIRSADVPTPGGGVRRIMTVPGDTCWNVRTKSNVLPGQLSHAVYSEIMANPDANFRRIFGDAKFPSEDTETQLIFGSWLPPHISAWHKARTEGPKVPVTAVGLDVADSKHGDYSVLAGGSEHGCRELLKRRKSDTMKTTAWVLSCCKDRWGIELKDGVTPICVDADGIGVGIADRLLELGCWVIHFKGQQTAENPRNFGNARAEAFGLLSNRLNPEEFDSPWAIPDDPLLLDELQAAEKIFDSDGQRYKLQPKRLAAGMKPPRNHRGDVISTWSERLGRSPDRADALAYLYTAVRTLAGGEPIESQFLRDSEVVVYDPKFDEEVDKARKSAKLKPKKSKPGTAADEVDAYLESILAMADQTVDDEPH